MQIRNIYMSFLNGTIFDISDVHKILKEKFDENKCHDELYDGDLTGAEFDANHIFRGLFLNDQKNNKFEPIEKWGHVSSLNILRDSGYYGIGRDDIIEGVASYLEIDWAKDERLDWLFIDILMFVEYIAIMEEVKKHTFNIFMIKKLGDLSTQARIAYDAILSQDWTVLQEDVVLSRRKGILWDKSVFDIINRNYKST